jgi:hypothetical protein
MRSRVETRPHAARTAAPMCAGMAARISGAYLMNKGTKERQTGSGSRQAEDVRSRDTRDASSAAKKQQRLRFTKEDEPPPPAPTVSEKAAAARRRADKADVKLERAQEYLPKTHQSG